MKMNFHDIAKKAHGGDKDSMTLLIIEAPKRWRIWTTLLKVCLILMPTTIQKKNRMIFNQICKVFWMGGKNETQTHSLENTTRI